MWGEESNSPYTSPMRLWGEESNSPYTSPMRLRGEESNSPYTSPVRLRMTHSRVRAATSNPNHKGASQTSCCS